ncbi:MAG: 8-amino-7-oxononanoate synthase [Candidatus Carbobacillus altaicus]|uniref:8-amino-7-ketopelargonate synthase n=1 Tax=Candidatus Carbonibacillus altaicus TaxID=2163959 RepID=A0A2R6XYA7_9BACL|nr:MAG: 8-amino-7-oxononanoate synthase [Candidatus Carbobacillus altaicus]
MTLEDELTEKLRRLKEAALLRRLVVRAGGVPEIEEMGEDGSLTRLLNFSSNDYLGLAGHPALKAAACEAAARHGAGAGASRLITGHAPWTAALEADLAAWMEKDAALLFSSGYAASVGTLSALIERDDVVLSDRLIHASLIDGIRLSRSRVRRYRHNDLTHLEALLKEVREREGKTRVWVVTESVFSMAGDVAPLQEIVELKTRYGAYLVVDEAHAVGLFGPRGGGVAEALGVLEEIEVFIGTLSKALGAVGGFVAGSQSLIDWLVSSARSFIYSTALPPAAVAAAREGLRIVQEEPERRRRALGNAAWFRDRLEALGALRVAPHFGESGAPPFVTPIVPLIVGSASQACRVSAALRARGILAVAIRPPTVPDGTARLRFSVSAAHSPDDLAHATEAAAWALEAAADEGVGGGTSGCG